MPIIPQDELEELSTIELQTLKAVCYSNYLQNADRINSIIRGRLWIIKDKGVNR